MSNTLESQVNDLKTFDEEFIVEAVSKDKKLQQVRDAWVDAQKAQAELRESEAVEKEKTEDARPTEEEI